uniref:G-protein coupled receptors family 1 profile domain-containing protein n=1 Tax=Denticeps clupeoides TaxID=299321 RepID=A0AAY4CMR8_9TELE
MLAFFLMLHVLRGAHGAGAPLAPCPPPCQCQESGMLLLVECAECGLSSVPDSLSPFTSYLDLSMNNISEIQPEAFQNLPFLSELRLSGNLLKHIPGPVFRGLYNLKVLMLENNQIQQLPSEAPWDLPNLLSLRLDANLITEVPAQAFSGLRSLRHLWLDDNALTEIPVAALNSLVSLQAMTLALNRITHIPDYTFHNLSNLVVLHLHNNMIKTLGQNCFEGLHSLETLELNYNELQEFPVAIRTLTKLQELGFHNNNIKAIPEKAFLGNPLLQTINFYENPIHSVGRSAFQFLPKLHTLSLNGAMEIQEFPDLKGTTSLEILTLTRAGLTVLPQNLLEKVTHCTTLPSFGHVVQQSVRTLPCLDAHLSHPVFPCRDLSWNGIEAIHADAFTSLQSLVKLDLTENHLKVLPLEGLFGLTHLKLRGNVALSSLFRVEDFPQMRVVEMPYAYQCCVYGACSAHRPAAQWNMEQTSEEDELHKKAAALLPVHTYSYDSDVEEFQMELDESKLQTSVQCTPLPGPFKPCEDMFDGWVVRLSMWAIALLSLVGNGLLLMSVFGSPSYLSPLKFIIGAISGANFLTGLCTGTLVVVDVLTFGEFAQHGARWESGVGCQATGFVTILASEASILFLTLAAVQCGISVSCVRAYGKSPSSGSVRAAALACVLLSVLVAALPLIKIGEYGGTPLCLPSPLPEGHPSTLGFMVALIMMNSLCFLIITGTYIKLYWDLIKGEFESIWDCAMIKHVAWLIFTNCLLYCPVAFLTFSSLLGLFSVAEEVVKSVLLVALPLPACLNPLLYLLFNPHFREDARMFCGRASLPPEEALDSFASLETEKSSYDSTQALVSFTEVDTMFETLPSLETGDCYQWLSPVPIIACQQKVQAAAQENVAGPIPSFCVKEEELLKSNVLDSVSSLTDHVKHVSSVWTSFFLLDLP